MPTNATHGAAPDYVPGGNYDAIRNPDGTYTIFDVPIMAAGKIRTLGGNEVDISEAWLARAIQNAARREAEGFMGRLHVHHHDGKDQVMDAGYLRPKRIGELVIGGRMRRVVFADFVAVPAEVYERIKAKRLPYRSFEANDVRECFIDGVALMPTRAPFYRLPLLTIGRELGSVPGLVAGAKNTLESATSVARNGLPWVAFASLGHAITGLARFDMGTSEKPKENAVRAQGDEPKDEAPPADTSGGEGGGRVDDLIEQINTAELTIDEIGKLKDALEEILQKITGSTPGDEKVAPEMPPMPSENPAEPAMAAEAVVDENSVRLQARLAALEGRLAARERQDEIERAVRAATASLSNYHLGSDREQTLRAVAEKHGAKGLSLFVETVKSYGAAAPPAGHALGVGGAGGQLPEDVMAVATTPEIAESATRAHAEFKDLQANGLLRGMSFKDYWEANARMYGG